ncbi:MAG: efflux transporter outer membrane subunit [Prevotella sp.]|jgi:NodT family efflux transporter outer membrane factor (OMF) lipoprotein|nr:efflux transporter outer membrane subunit [Prevotella sp.]
MKVTKYLKGVSTPLHIGRGWGWVLFPLLLSSCGVYTKYERPEVNTKGIIRDVVSDVDTLKATADTTTFANLPWRQVFTDPQLQALIQQGLDKNPDLLNAALNVQIVESQLKMSKLAFLPQVTFSPQGVLSSWDFGKASQTYSMPLNASWTVDLFGNLLNQKRSSQMALLATKDYQVVVKTKIVSGIANMYYTLLMLDRQLEILNDMSGLTKDTWDMMKLQMQLGRYRSTSVQSAEASHYSVLTQIEDMKRQIREVENSLSLLIGQPAQTIKRGKLADQVLPSQFATGVGIQLLKNRADVHAAEMNLASSFYDVNTARSRFYPSLTISGTGSYTNSGGGMIVNPGKILASAVASLVQPIFMNGKLTEGLKISKAQYEQDYNTWQNAVLTAGSEVSNALVQYNSYQKKSELDAHRVEVLKKNVEDTRALVSSSTSTYLEVIQAQNSLLNAEISKVTDDFNKMQAVVSLYQALGGGSK